MKFCISTLTHNDIHRDVYLKKTIDSFIKNTDFIGPIDWYIHCNGKNELINEVIKECIEKYHDLINFKYTYSENNMGVGVGINYLNNLIKDYEYVLFLEGDWICLPSEVSGHIDWLNDCLNYLDNNKHISQVLLRRYISDLDDRQYGFGYWIKESNVKNIIQLKNQYIELIKKEYTNNPHLRRNKDFFDYGIYPLKEFYNEDGSPAEIKGNRLWGQAEINAEPRGYEINSSYLTFGNMVHCEHWNYYEKYEELYNEVSTCKKYTNTGNTGCKYGYFFPNNKFCEVCDHSKNFTNLENHEQEYEKNL